MFHLRQSCVCLSCDELNELLKCSLRCIQLPYSTEVERLKSTFVYCTIMDDYSLLNLRICTICNKWRRLLKLFSIDLRSCCILTGGRWQFWPYNDGRAYATVLRPSVCRLPSSSVTLLYCDWTEQKLLLTAYRKSHMRNRLVPKWN